MDSNTNINEDQKNKKKNDRRLFYGVIAVSTFILMVVGATFAYFTANTSSADQSVTTQSTQLELEYINYGTAWMRNDLIPVHTVVAQYSVENQDDSTAANNGTTNHICEDDSGNGICSIYVFQIRNTANSDQTASISLRADDIGFENLHAMIYKVSKRTCEEGDTNCTAYVDTLGVQGGTDPDFVLNSETVVDPTDTTKKYITDNINTNLFTDTYPASHNNYQLEPVYINRANVVKELLQYNKETVNQETGATVTTRTNSVDVAIPFGSSDFIKLADGVNIPGASNNQESNLVTFMVVLYIKDNDQNQNNSDSNKTFMGTISVSTDDTNGTNRGVTGIISAAPSQTTTTTETPGTTTESQGG